MKRMKRMLRKEFKMEFKVIIKGIRIVMVKNIGIKKIEEMIGGGGLGILVFKGIGKKEMDIVMIGEMKKVIIDFEEEVIIDEEIEIEERGKKEW